MRVLFVCMGNICRSPTAHYIFLKKLKEQKLEDKIEVDSAGTHDYHVGSRCDPRTYQHAFKRGYDIQHRARHFKKADFESFDYILVADDNNLDRLLAMRPNEEEKKKIHKTTDFCMQLKVNEVPDPYYGGEAGFERVLDILEDACEGLLQEVKPKLNT
jgi:protein-tyrosine phosphatase